MFQQTVTRNIGFGVGGELFLVGPTRVQPARLASPTPSNNVIGRAFTIIDDATASFDTFEDPQPLDVRAGGTGVFAGLLIGPKVYEVLDGLDPVTTLANNTMIELAQESSGVIVTVPAGAAIGDWLWFDQVTGALSTSTPGGSVAGASRVPGGRVTRYESAAAGLVVIELDANQPTASPGVFLPAGLGFNSAAYGINPSISDPGGFTAATGDAGTTPEAIFDQFSTARSAPANTYYVGTGGSNSNSGLSPALKKLSIDSAIAAGNATGQPYKIVPDSIEMVRNLGFNGATPTQDIAVVPANGGRLNVGTFNNFTALTVDATYANCYSGTTGNTDRVCNRLALNAYGNFTDHVKFATAAALSAATLTADSYAYEGGRLYIRRLDGLQPTPANTRQFSTSVKNFSITTEVNVWIENVDLEGGQVGALEYIRGAASANRKVVVAKNCSFKYGGGDINTDGRSLTVDGINGLAAFFNCTANAAKTDGFNFHDVIGNGTQHLTVNCIGNDNGRMTAESCNGLTGHEQTVGIDLGGTYRGNHGGTVRGSTGRILLAGALVKDDLGSVVIGGATPPTAILTSGSEYWLDRAKIDMPSGQQAILASGTGKVHKRAVLISAGAVEGGSGTIDTY